MVNLADFRADTKAIQDGAWVRVNEALYGDLEILTRGFTDVFLDAQRARLRKAAQPYANDQDRIPNAIMRAINAGLLREYLVLDVRNLVGETGAPVDIKEFHALLGDVAYTQLSAACWQAALRVSTQSAEQLEDAAKNSPRPSKQNSNGELRPTSEPNL